MSSDQKPTSTEPEPSGLAKSFEDRLTFPDTKKANGTNAEATPFTPSKFNWADESTTPTQESDKPTELGQTSDTTKGQTDGAAKDSVEAAQKDGATPWLMGSDGLDEPEFDVNVKLADLQADPNNPLFSAQSFEELNLWVTRSHNARRPGH